MDAIERAITGRTKQEQGRPAEWPKERMSERWLSAGAALLEERFCPRSQDVHRAFFPGLLAYSQMRCHSSVFPRRDTMRLSCVYSCAPSPLTPPEWSLLSELKTHFSLSLLPPRVDRGNETET